jgi:hypothetical protein
MIRRSSLLLLLLPLLAACGGSSSPSGFPTIQAARTYSLVNLSPSAPVPAGKPIRVSFAIKQPNGKLMTSFKRGPGPHTGVHLILVRRDLAAIVHTHPPIAPSGTIGTTLTLPKPGPYRVVIDAYPNTTGPQKNFQLFGSVRAKGAYVPQKLPPFAPSDIVDGYRITLHDMPELHAIQAAFLQATVTAPDGKPAVFTAWFGALAHAIFFRKGSLDYFHTHVCAPGASGCTSVLGASKVTGSSSTPGKLTIGVLVPAPGTWRLFLQCKVEGHVLTAPFTLEVKP